MVTYYVIRHKLTGQYISVTPSYHNWSTDPRLFLSIGRLRSFITSVLKQNARYRRRHPDACDNLSKWIVDEMVLTVTNTK